MKPVKTAIVVSYFGLLFLIIGVDLQFIIKEDLIVALLFYGFGVILIAGSIGNLIKGSEKDMSTKVFLLLVAVITVFIIVLIGHIYFTAGEHEAVIYYKKEGDMFVLKGVKVHVKPQRLSGKYRLKLSFNADTYGEFGLVSYDPTMVRISYNSYEEEYILVVYAKEVITLKQNTEYAKYFDFGGCLVVKKPLDFDVSLVPVGGGWVINIGNTEVLVSI
jgi:hypothetical protein